MFKSLTKLFALLAVATPLVLAGCHSGGDEHPGQSTSEHPESSTGSTSEHPN